MTKLKQILVSLCMLALLLPVASSLHAGGHKKTIALLPGVVDPFYFTMHRGAKHAADALGVNLLFQVTKQWNVSVQVPILHAIIAKKHDAILIAPITPPSVLIRGSAARIPIPANINFAFFCINPKNIF